MVRFNADRPNSTPPKTVKGGKAAASASKTNKGKGSKKTPVPLRHGVPEIVEPRCSVCKNEYRREIDKMLVMGHSQADILRHFDALGMKFTQKAMSVHKTKHLTLKHHAVRQALERRMAGLVDDVDEVEGYILSRNAIFEVMRTKMYERLMDGSMEFSPTDMFNLLDRIEAVEKDEQQVNLDSMVFQINALIAAIKAVVPKSLWQKVIEQWEINKSKTNPLHLPKGK